MELGLVWSSENYFFLLFCKHECQQNVDDQIHLFQKLLLPVNFWLATVTDLDTELSLSEAAHCAYIYMVDWPYMKWIENSCDILD